VILAVRRNGVPFVVDTAHHVRKRARLAPDHEKRRLDALGSERAEHAVGVGRQRTVVEGEHHLLVLERQALVILHRADAGVLGRIDGDHAGGAECVGVAGAVRRERGHARYCQREQPSYGRPKSHRATSSSRRDGRAFLNTSYKLSERT
jgi:hypothetical protein